MAPYRTEDRDARMEAKIDRLADDMQAIRTSITEMNTRFETWPDVSRRVADHEVRITALEAFESKRIDERLQVAEKTISGFKGWLAGATATAMIVGGIMVWFLNKLAGSVGG